MRNYPLTEHLIRIGSPPVTHHDLVSSPVTGLEWSRGFREIKVPRFHDNATGC
jgi:hypothetical protein